MPERVDYREAAGAERGAERPGERDACRRADQESMRVISGEKAIFRR